MEKQDDIRVIVGKRLSEIRREQGKTQKEISEKIKELFNIEIKQGTLSSYEKGKTLPPINTLIALSKTYNVSLDWICGNSNERGNVKDLKYYTDVMDFIFSMFKNEFLDLSIEHIYPTYPDGEDRIGISFNDKLLFDYILKLEDITKAFRNESGIDSELLELWHEKQIREFSQNGGNLINPF